MFCFVCKSKTASSYHRFPKNLELRKKWVDFLKVDGEELTPRTTICENHFNKDCVVSSGKRHFLKHGSIPSVRIKKCRSKGKKASKICTNSTTGSINCKTNEIASVKDEVITYVKEETVYNDDQKQIFKEDQDPLDLIPNKSDLCTQKCESSKLETLTNFSNLPSDKILLKSSELWAARYLNNIKLDEVVQSPEQARKALLIAFSLIKTQKKKILALHRKNRLLCKKYKMCNEFTDNFQDTAMLVLDQVESGLLVNIKEEISD